MVAHIAPADAEKRVPSLHHVLKRARIDRGRTGIVLDGADQVLAQIGASFIGSFSGWIDADSPFILSNGIYRLIHVLRQLIRIHCRPAVFAPQFRRSLDLRVRFPRVAADVLHVDVALPADVRPYLVESLVALTDL